MGKFSLYGKFPRFTSMPPTGPSSVHFRVFEIVSHTWMIASKLPDARKFPSALNANVETESVWPTLNKE